MTVPVAASSYAYSSTIPYVLRRRSSADSAFSGQCSPTAAKSRPESMNGSRFTCDDDSAAAAVPEACL
jgi:hypothetical protein